MWFCDRTASAAVLEAACGGGEVRMAFESREVRHGRSFGGEVLEGAGGVLAGSDHPVAFERAESGEVLSALRASSGDLQQLEAANRE